MIWKIVDLLLALLGGAFFVFFIGLLLCGLAKDLWNRLRKHKLLPRFRR